MYQARRVVVYRTDSGRGSRLARLSRSASPFSLAVGCPGDLLDETRLPRLLKPPLAHAQSSAGDCGAIHGHSVALARGRLRTRADGASLDVADVNQSLGEQHG